MYAWSRFILDHAKVHKVTVERIITKMSVKIYDVIIMGLSRKCLFVCSFVVMSFLWKSNRSPRKKITVVDKKVSAGITLSTFVLYIYIYIYLFIEV
jgi:small-conductance mechanosensitive channel